MRLWASSLLLTYCCQDPSNMIVGSSLFIGFAGKIERADERARTADLISLRVLIHALQGVAEDCKCRISKPYSFLQLAVRCTVLHSRWCQSGVRRRWITRRRLFELDWRVAIETAYPQGVRFVLDYAIRWALVSRSRTRPRSPRSSPRLAVPQSRVAPLHRSSAYLPPRRSARTSPRASGLSADGRRPHLRSRGRAACP
jgi:hypothetical protein